MSSASSALRFRLPVVLGGSVVEGGGGVGALGLRGMSSSSSREMGFWSSVDGSGLLDDG